MVLCMQQSYDKATTSSKSTYISSLGEVSGLQLYQVIIAGSFLSSNCSSQLQSFYLLSFPAKPFPEAAADVSTAVVTMTVALLAAVTMTMYTLFVYKMSYFRSILCLQLLRSWTTRTVQTLDLRDYCVLANLLAHPLMLNNICLMSLTKKKKFKGEEVTPVARPHVLLSTLSLHRHIVYRSAA